MNSEQAKKLSLPAILSKLGHQPVKTLKGGFELWYNSPFRKEIEPSFHTSFLGNKWIWNDFGDTGGTVLDFATRYYHTDIKGALANLESLIGDTQQSLFFTPSVPLTPPQATNLPASDKTLSLHKINALSVDSFNGKALLQYLTNQRGINSDIAIKYLVEVQYRNNENGKTYFAAGIRNENEGYEIRNAYFKSSIGQKGISFVKGKGQGKAAVFEGFMDFLSALTYYQSRDLAKFQSLLEADILIMNSTSFQEQTKDLLKAGNYSKISLYLDNDTTGQKVKAFFTEQFKNITEDCSIIYQDYKDFNDFLKNNTLKKTNKSFDR
jgi:hypothetical protein